MMYMNQSVYCVLDTIVIIMGITAREPIYTRYSYHFFDFVTVPSTFLINKGESPIGPKFLCEKTKVSKLMVITMAAKPKATFQLKCSGITLANIWRLPIATQV